ncbi:putative esterase/lipase [Syntrophobotulus glycolicus DSM 8271]|uniref:Esterase/lipase n=1 Tax=Syntrophobotulus glycolicus (strain DSM 8271 / FlGlyR) TaxID=645991 RepID=F0T1P7_SYNGF|nr:alpha/beta fold hydrolase [Syntrophobotulus glycolicus]ADY57471.1 putative esterase/lipase [Syntrophobotulus glycolicus DSM 8271]
MLTKEELIQPFILGEGRAGVVLIHGFTACPIDMRPLGEYLAGKGYTVHAPLLAGHGATPQELSMTKWEDWRLSAQEAVVALRRRCSKVLAIGHSMGGLIALSLAASGEIEGVASINAPIIYGERELYSVERLLPKIQYLDKPNKENEIHINKEGIPHFSYTQVPIKCLVSLTKAITPVQKSLAQVKCPSLIIQGLEDKTVNPRSGRIIEKSITKAKKEVIYWQQEDHYIVLSTAREELGMKIDSFFEKYGLKQ